MEKKYFILAYHCDGDYFQILDKRKHNLLVFSSDNGFKRKCDCAKACDVLNLHNIVDVEDKGAKKILYSVLCFDVLSSASADLILSGVYSTEDDKND